LREVTRRGAVAATLALAVIIAPSADAARGKHSAAKRDPLKIPNSALDLTTWESLDGWAQDNHSEALGAYLTSCRALTRLSEKSRTPIQAALADICRRAYTSLPLDDSGARAFFEKNFRPVRLAPLGERDGFFTGYYEPIIDGAKFPSDKFTTPLYRRPPDMLISRIRHSAKKGKLGKRVVKKVAPFYDRVAIEEGAIAGRDLEIAYVNPIDAFFAQIQGSVRVRLEDGAMLRLNYDAQNGHPYTAVGKFLIERKIFTREEISMQKIHDWMDANPDEGKALRRENKSFVFFKETPLGAQDEPPGAQGIALTPGRSIAVDRNLHTYGMPFFIDAVLPIQSEKPDTKFRRLMVAQDTGGAIIGPARADIYLGAGDEAARAAGRFKQFGRFVMLVPNELDPGRLERDVPLPLPRPKTDGAVAERREEPVTSTSSVAAPKAEPKTVETKPAEKPAAATRTAETRIDPAIPLPKASPLKKKQ
jgi:membrane-bound lytic murein transglycosylase A